jgi:hypothetical protein
MEEFKSWRQRLKPVRLLLSVFRSFGLKTMYTATGAQILEIFGALIFLLLGLIHGVLTFQDLSQPRTFTPPDAALRQAMQESRIAIHPQTNLWNAWLGFNLSHSLGLIMFGGTYFGIGLFCFSAFAQFRWLPICPVLVAMVYLILSIRFWFSSPVIAASMALTCFVMAWLVLLNLSSSPYSGCVVFNLGW